MARRADRQPRTARLAYGGLAGAFVGFCRGPGGRGRTALALWTSGAVFGGLGGGLSVLAVATTSRLHPILNSSLAIAAAGFCAGLCGCAYSRHGEPGPNESTDEEEEPAAPDVKIEWLLREPKRRWRASRALVRVLPVLAVSTGSLAGAAALTPSRVAFALLAVALLGVIVARVLYRQEQRLDALERQFRQARDS